MCPERAGRRRPTASAAQRALHLLVVSDDLSGGPLGNLIQIDHAADYRTLDAVALGPIGSAPSSARSMRSPDASSSAMASLRVTSAGGRAVTRNERASRVEH